MNNKKSIYNRQRDDRGQSELAQSTPWTEFVEMLWKCLITLIYARENADRRSSAKSGMCAPDLAASESSSDGD